MQLCSSDLWTQVPKSCAGAVLIVVLRSELLCALSLLVPLVGAGTSQVPSELLFASSSPVPLASFSMLPWLWDAWSPSVNIYVFPLKYILLVRSSQNSTGETFPLNSPPFNFYFIHVSQVLTTKGW